MSNNKNSLQKSTWRETGEIVGERKEFIRKRNRVTLTNDSFLAVTISPVATTS